MSAASITISGPDRIHTKRNVQLSVPGLRKCERTVLTEAEHGCGPKLVGCGAVTLGVLLSKFVRDENLPGVSGVLIAGDGVKTNPIHVAELSKGLLVHSDAAGAELSAGAGGPLRVVFPPGVAVQTSVCGTPKPINLKGAVRLVLTSDYEIKDPELERALNGMAVRVIGHMNDDHAASVKAYAAHAAQCGATKALEGRGPADVASARMIGVDGRGFSLSVSLVGEPAPVDVLISFPRPLEKAADVRKLAVELHQSAYDALGVGYKLREGYYTSMAQHAASGMAAALAKRAGGASRPIALTAAVATAVVAVAVVKRLAA